MPTLGTLTLTEARHAILRREFSCVEYAYAMIERHARWRYLNGFTCVDDARLLAEAARCDRDLATSSTPHALLGLPIAIKDNIDTACLPTGNGTLALHNRVPPQHAPVVARLLAQGALIAGKANLHELAFGVSGNNRVTGAVRNPYDFNRIPGGSSSGSGALVGAGVVPAALGTDTGGSVRIPAALCGAVGLRPTVGRYPSGGVAPISRTRDTVGPIARSVEDIALLDAILSGTGAHAPMSLPTRGTTRSVRLAVPRTTFWRGLAQDVERVANAAVAKLAQAGFECVDIDLNDYPGFFDDEPAIIAMYEFRSSMHAYLVENGYDLSVDDIVANVGSPDVAKIARHITGPDGIGEAAYRTALDRRTRSRAAYRQCLADSGADALVFPTTIATACPIPAGDVMMLNGEPASVFSTYIRNTEPGSNAGVPGMTVPAGLTAAGLPVGLALDGAAGTDRELIAVALEVERVLGRLPEPNDGFGVEGRLGGYAGVDGES
ncbi:indoleacetamide hydrolase [Burkholderia sp. HI2500]|uniref:indoleacetamide hydrolase n=1 Tax=Burkholderia sp. HI2500 TaxID=2015358 RepID=UPI000B7ACEAB|nr:indoleacetamide hydrolase [Burkholderia sp. HI2500]OXJ07345.1 amidase [Burkholderia sp. HI2500]